jgi:hypothetical protein
VYRASTAHAIIIVGPICQDPRAVERPGFAKEDVHVDWRAETVTCPRGTVSPRWKPMMADGKPRLSVLFRRADCRACTTRQQCTGNVDGKGRHLLLLPEPLQEIQNRTRSLQQTPEWKRRYALRAGCEAAVSETVHAHGLRHCRCRGLTKTHVQHVLAAAGTNIVRLAQHLAESGCGRHIIEALATEVTLRPAMTAGRCLRAVMTLAWRPDARRRAWASVNVAGGRCCHADAWVTCGVF